MTSNLQRQLRSAPLLMPAVALIAGIIAGQHVDDSTCWLLFMVSLVATVCLQRWPSWRTATMLLGMVALGGMRSAEVKQQHDRVTWPDECVAYEAVVVSETAETPKTVAMDIVIAGDGRKVKCYIMKDDKSLRLTVGDRVKLSSRIERNSEWRHGAFDYQRYLEIHGFSGRTMVGATDWQLMSRSWQGLSAWQRLWLHFLCHRHALLNRYREMGADGEAYAVVAAMTLGDKSAMTEDLREVYAVSGASHVLALSGLHVGIIYMLLTLLVVGRRSRFVVQILAVLGIWAFALLAGLPISVIRSAVLISVYALLSLIGRNRASLNVLALAALIILIACPDSLYDVGFQLSFVAVLAILIVQPMLEGLVSREWLFGHPVLRWAWGLATVSVAAQLGVAPLIAYYFGRFSTWFLLTNFIVIPATTVILWLAIGTLLLPVLGGALLQVVGWLNAALSFVSTRLPCPSIDGLHPSALQTAVVYVIMIAMLVIIVKYDKRI